MSNTYQCIHVLSSITEAQTCDMISIHILLHSWFSCFFLVMSFPGKCWQRISSYQVLTDLSSPQNIFHFYCHHYSQNRCATQGTVCNDILPSTMFLHTVLSDKTYHGTKLVWNIFLYLSICSTLSLDKNVGTMWRCKSHIWFLSKNILPRWIGEAFKWQKMNHFLSKHPSAHKHSSSRIKMTRERNVYSPKWQSRVNVIEWDV